MSNKTVAIVTGGTNSAPSTAAELNAVRTDFVSSGIVGAVTLNTGSGGSGGFAVNAQGTPAMSVRVSAGDLYVSATPSGGTSQKVRVDLDAFEDVTIAANSTGSTRYDWVYLQLDATKLANPGVNKDDVATLVTSRSTSSSTDNGTPPTFGYNLAVVTVANSATSITNSNITDNRVQSGLSSLKGTVNLTQGAAASDAKVQASGTDTNINLALLTKGNGLVKTTVLRQDDTTNTYQTGNTAILTGWGKGVPGAASGLASAVTFGVTFLQKPIVTLVYGGDATSATTYGSGGSNVKQAVALAGTITTTGFTAVINTRDGTSWSAGNVIFYQWTAIGEIA